MLEGFASVGRLSEFIDEFVKINIEDDRWEIYMHRVWDKPFDVFCAELDEEAKNRTMPQMTLEATVKKSMDILNTFNPNEEGGE